MALYIKANGQEWNADDVTVDDVDQIERETGTAWTELKPLGGSMRMTKAFLRVAWKHLGLDPAEVGRLPVRELLDHFEPRGESEEGPAEPETPTKGRKARSPRESSGTAPSATPGPPESPDSNT